MKRYRTALSTLLVFLLLAVGSIAIAQVSQQGGQAATETEAIKAAINNAIGAAAEAGKGVPFNGKLVPAPTIASAPIMAFLKEVIPQLKVFDVKDYGAIGDGKALDTAAINAAIDAAAKVGIGGVVYFPAGIYLSGSIHLKSNTVLYLSKDATILGAPNNINAYDSHHSLIWGEGLENVAIIGEGTINGGGMTRKDPPPGGGDKTIALLRCKTIMIYGIKIKHAGHFAVLPTGCDNMIIDSVMIDTNRDGIDIDACHNVVISNCMVNSPHDDAIVPKSSYALGYKRASENILVKNCYVSGYQEGSLLGNLPKIGIGKGRFKLGTESNGGFKNIVFYNSHLQNCQGIALEEVDGGVTEDVYILNDTCNNTPKDAIFIRLGNRARGPASPPPGEIRNIYVHNVTVTNAESAVDISGIPGHQIENVELSNVIINVKGGGTKAQAAIVPPEVERSYPEPGMFGTLPAYGFFVRHVKGLKLKNVSVNFTTPDMRPAVVFDDVQDVDVDTLNAERAPGGEPTLTFRENVSNVSVHNSPSIPLVEPAYSEMRVSKDHVVADEPFSLTVTATNNGLSAGMADVELFVDGKAFATKYVWLDPNEPKDVVFSDLRLYTPGSHELRVGKRTPWGVETEAGLVTAVVVKPTEGRFSYSDLEASTPLVTGMVGEGKIGKIKSTALTAEEKSIIKLAVKNVGSYTHTEKVVLSINDKEIESKDLTLGPGESKKVEFEYTFPTSGDYKISVGNLTKDVYVWNARGKFVCMGLENINTKSISPGKPFMVYAWITDTEYNPNFYGNQGGKIDLYVDGKLASWGFVSARKGEVKEVGIKLALEAGQHVISVGKCTKTVTIKPRPTS